MENVKITEVLDLEKDFFYFAKTRKDAKIPTKREEDAGYDIYACFDDDYVIIYPHTCMFIETGISSALSSNFYLEAKERGSNAAKNIKVSAGIIDSGFRDSIKIALSNLNNIPVIISKLPEEKLHKQLDRSCFFSNYSGFVYYPYQKAIAQLILHRVHNELQPQTVCYDFLKSIPSERGTGMCGSSGK